MNIARDNDIFIIIASLIIFFFVIGAGIAFFVLLYYKRRRTYLKENELLKANYEKSLLQSRLEVQEQSFDFISQELHDNIGQLLSLAKVQLNIIDQKKTYDALAMTEVKENISKAINDLRDMARGLNTGNIHLSALTDLVTVEISRINRTGLLLATLELKGDEPKIKNDHKLILFRIIQESLQNIIKH